MSMEVVDVYLNLAYGGRPMPRQESSSEIIAGYNATDRPYVVNARRTTLKPQFVLVNEEGEEYEKHDNLMSALNTLYEYPNDSIRISLVRA